ncbi:hypothetical protein AVEN_203473-1 [Araneus ventricosus]|uniref:Uncharacterized protein n=1 Tax=Araneus ventricosus TaxID=182803 RepID=A0A4Y2BIB4_ARAVE|nr:hypothetical protein AVEN_203473-1 [Araneus ventricosus]
MPTDYQFEAVSMPFLPKLPTDTRIYLGCKRLTLLRLKEKQPFLPCIAAVESTTCGPAEDARRWQTKHKQQLHRGEKCRCSSHFFSASAESCTS